MTIIMLRCCEYIQFPCHIVCIMCILYTYNNTGVDDIIVE